MLGLWITSELSGAQVGANVPIDMLGYDQSPGRKLTATAMPSPPTKIGSTTNCGAKRSTRTSVAATSQPKATSNRAPKASAPPLPPKIWPHGGAG